MELVADIPLYFHCIKSSKGNGPSGLDSHDTKDCKTGIHPYGLALFETGAMSAEVNYVHTTLRSGLRPRFSHHLCCGC